VINPVEKAESTKRWRTEHYYL